MKQLTEAGARANCDRCGRLMQVAAKRREDSWPFKLAAKPKGFCADCVMTQFLYNTYPINMQIDQSGPELLLKPAIRECFLMSGLLDKCDLNIDEVIWQRVVANWHLPVEQKRSATNPYTMGDAAREREALKKLENAVAINADCSAAILEAVGCDPDKAREALERDGAMFLTSMGFYRTSDLVQRRKLRSLIEDCKFCRGRGCSDSVNGIEDG